MTNYWNYNKGITEIRSWEPRCWVQLTDPDEAERLAIERQFGLPDYFIKDICDADERPRYETEDGWQLIILRIPYAKETQSRTPFTTIPLGIINRGEVLITVCAFKSTMLSDFIAYQQRRALGFIDYVDMTFRLFLSSAVWYLKRLRQISGFIERAKHNLDHSVDNQSLIGLSRLQDSLTYFITSIRANENLLAKLKFKLPVDDLDVDLIEDVNIEMSQARDTAQIYSAILDSTMDTYSSIISNNMNTVMRVLTSVSIILMLPTLISSLFGMNLINGLEDLTWGFPFALILSFVISIGCWIVFRWKHLI